MVLFTFGVCKQRNTLWNVACIIQNWCSCSIANESAVLVRLVPRSRHDRHDGKRCEVPVSLSSPFALKRRGCSASLPCAAMWRSRDNLPEMLPAAEVGYNSTAYAVFGISPCSDRRWPCVLRETLHPLDHDARSKGELHGTGARRGDGPAISSQ